MRTTVNDGHSHEYQRNWNMTSYVEDEEGDMHCHTIIYKDSGGVYFLPSKGHTHYE